MSDRHILRLDGIDPFLKAILSAGRRIVAPVRRAATASFPDGQVVFGALASPEQLATDYLQTDDSAKAVVFPRYDPLVRFRRHDRSTRFEHVDPGVQPTVLFGLRPCDAAALAPLRAVFTWDSPDEQFEPRFAALTVIAIACTRADEFCFCTSVGGGPGDTRGSDILITPTQNAHFHVNVLTPAGAAIVQLAPHLFKPSDGNEPGAALADVTPRFSADRLTERLPTLFDRGPAWEEPSLRCIGCGACAYLCPVCSCFDIQDEQHRDHGVRLRCWDSCGLAHFTIHASGHNPRSRQTERWRQRIMHKFRYQPERLGVLGCVGCGRCSRACPADMNLAEHLQTLAESPP